MITIKRFSSRFPFVQAGQFWRVWLSALIMGGCLSISVAMASDGALADLVNRANEAANRQDYPQAVRLYEQVVQKAPEEATLRANLAVLYANYAVELQEQNKFEEALPLYDKAFTLAAPDSQQTRKIQQAKAGTLFGQAMHIRDGAASLTPEDSELIKALLMQAIEMDPQEPAFKKALANAYQEDAYRLATQEEYEAAIVPLQQALEIDPQNRSVKQSLANVYLGMAKNAASDEAAKSWIEKALAMDDSPRLKENADRLSMRANAGAGEPDARKKGDGGPSDIKAIPPAAISELSVAEMIRDMEVQLKIESEPKATMLERLTHLEKQIYGKTQDGPMAVRAKNAYTSLMGSYSGVLADSGTHIRQAPAVSSEHSYLDEIFKTTDGKVIRWGKFPIRVYLDTPKEHPLFRPEYREAALHGLNAWKVTSNGYVNFVEIKDPDLADVHISWTDEYVDRFADPETTPDFYKNYAPPKRHPLTQVLQVASMFAPGYFSLAPQALAAGLQYQQYKKLEVIREESKIKLGLAPTRDLDPEAAQRLIQNMAAKEFGHALGLKGHSSKSDDLMYPELRSDVAQLPSHRDLETLRDLYSRPANIILNVR